MKRIALLLLALCLVLPCMNAGAAEEKLPKMQFPAANYVAYINYDFSIQMDVRTSGSLQSAKTMELRDQNGRVWASKDFKPGAQSFTFKMALDESHEGGFDLAVFCGDVQVSTNTAYVAVTDKHRKAIQTLETDEPYMAITFDCAYVDTPTDEILAILDEFGIKCTFFMTGEFVQTFPESAKKIAAAGHEIACHSLSHPHLLSYHLDMRFKQVRRNVEIIQETLGVNPRLFRPPFGEFDVTISAPARAEGMEICLWTIDSKDWKYEVKAPEVLKRVTKDITPGTIILFHLDGYFTPEVIREAIPYYQNELGLNLVPVTELMEKAGRELPASPYED